MEPKTVYETRVVIHSKDDKDALDELVLGILQTHVGKEKRISRLDLVKTFGWSLFEIDNTDIESLLPFIRRLVKTKGEIKKPERLAYADEVDWL